MKAYEIFGGTLESLLPFPELQPARTTRVDWTFDARTDPPPESAGALIGEDRVDANIRVRVRRCADRIRLEYDDTGTFDVLGGGRDIIWYRPRDVSEEAARLDVLGRVLAVALHARGWLALHASGVVMNGRAIAFVAPKHSGKSTLAFALARSGAQLLTDDTLAVLPGCPPVAAPGVHALRLFEDSADWLRLPLVDSLPTSAAAGEQKFTFPDVGASQCCREISPLEAVYVLQPRAAGARNEPLARTSIDGTAAAIELLRYAKVGPLLGGSEAPRLLDRAVAVARHVRVYRAEVSHDFARLPEICSQLRVWHASSARGNEACEGLA